MNLLLQAYGKKRQSKIFIAIVFAQFCGTSLWFAGNAILPQLHQTHGWPPSALAHLTGAVQLGFIIGTLVFSLMGFADRYSPSKVFFISCVTGALCNSLALVNDGSFTLMLISRGLTGICLAGIYPVGMKIAADWREHGLGNWLGALVGALVLGTAFPHVLKLAPQFEHPAQVLLGVSTFAMVGGIILLFSVPDGPYRKKATAFSFKSVRQAFQISTFRAPALGYFGHMWELYAFWAFVPWALLHFTSNYSNVNFSISWFSFFIIGVGGLGCWIGGKLSFVIGSSRVALYALIASGLCCLISPLMWQTSPFIFLIYMVIWGTMVVADSPQFSALVAANAPSETRGSAITLVTCIGFTITIGSIQLLNFLETVMNKDYLFLVLFPGPLAGIVFMSMRYK